MINSYILRRRNLGRTSVREIVRQSSTGIKVVRNWVDHLPDDLDALCIRWGCTSFVPHRNVVNRAAAIHAVSDKSGFRRILNDADLCPNTWFGFKDFKYPCIIRPATHSRGKQVYLCENETDAVVAITLCGDGWYASDYIDKVAEYRVFCMSGRALCVASKTPGNPGDIAWNVAQGGRFDNVRWDDWPLKGVKTALEGFALSGLDFGGVDIMVDKDNNWFILEINSAPSLTSPYRQECFTKGLDYIVNNGKAVIPLIEEKGGYRKFIHPAVCDTAIIV